MARRPLRWLLIAAVPMLLWGVQRLGNRPPPARPSAPSAVVARGNLAVRVLATGRVEPALQAQIRSRVGGVVAEVLVSEGQKVRPGDILLKLDPADHQRAVERVAAEVAERSAELRLALQRRGTVRKGLEHRVLAAVEMDTAEAEVSLTRARLKATRVNQKTAHDRLRYATIVAPFAGTIIHRNVQPGEVVAPGMTATMEGRPLLVIGDASRLLIRSELNQIDFARVELGQAARVTFDALSGRVYQATVSSLPASSTKGAAGTEVFQVQLELQASDDLAHVKPGMNADVEISIAEKQNVLLLPVEALNAEKAARSVQVWSPTVGRYETRPVQTGEHDDHRVEILNGLSEGDRVLTGSLESSAER